MKSRQGTRLVLQCCAMAFGVSLLAGCSSSFGGGADPSNPKTVVVAPGTRVVCQDGTAPPCNY